MVVKVLTISGSTVLVTFLYPKSMIVDLRDGQAWPVRASTFVTPISKSRPANSL